MKTNIKSERGSVLILAMIISLAIAVSIGSYFSLASSGMKMSNRSYHYSAAMNVAETGLEEAMWSINQQINGNALAFSSTYGWSVSGNDATQKFGGFNLGTNTDGYTNVIVKHYNGVGGAPTLVARAVLTLPQGAPVEKWVEVTLSKRSKFASGLVAKRSITFAGTNPSVDSWNSAASSPAVPYNSPLAVHHDKGPIGTLNIDSDITVQNADIWGSAAVGGDSTT